jgi:hypothetical protein
MSRVFAKYSTTYTVTRITTTNGAYGETTSSVTHDITAYIHPDDYKSISYNQQGERLTDRVKIFVKDGVDILDRDEVTYKGKQYRVMSDSDRDIGNYKKLIGELVA